MPRDVTETAVDSLIHIQVRTLDPKAGGIPMDRAHVEVTIPFVRSDAPGEVQTQTVAYKITDEGPRMEKAETIREVLDDEQRELLATVIETLVNKTKARLGF